MRACALIVGVALLAGCASPTTTPRDLPSPSGPLPVDFPVADRPSCTGDVITAVAAGDIAKLKQLAAARAEFSCRGNYGEPPLDAAVVNDDVDAVRVLLEGGADPNLRWAGHGDRFPLQEAVMLSGHYRQRQIHRGEVVTLLIAHGADVNARFCMFESRQGGGREKGCTAATAETPLTMAALFDLPDVVALLLAAGARPDTERGDRTTALDMAKSEAVYNLIVAKAFASEAAAVADFSARAPGPLMPRGQSPLTDAVSGGFYGVARLLLGAGATREESNAALAAAAMRNAATLGELLIAHGADAQSRSCPDLGRLGVDMTGCQAARGATPSMVASAVGGRQFLSILPGQDGADAVRDWRGRTARDYARLTGHAGMFPPGVPTR